MGGQVAGEVGSGSGLGWFEEGTPGGGAGPTGTARHEVRADGHLGKTVPVPGNDED